MDNTRSSLNIGVRGHEVNGSLNSSFGTCTGGTSAPTFTGVNPHEYSSGISVPNVTVSNGTIATATWQSPRSAVGDFLKVQYADVEVRCAITRKMVPAGRPVMLLGGMVISQEAFENWLEEHLAGMIGRHGDLHTDNANYDE
jgi:hypothetical protein